MRVKPLSVDQFLFLGLWKEAVRGGALGNMFVPVSRLIAVDSDGGGRTELVPDFDHQAGDPTLTADGQRIAFSFTGDLTGENADGNPEIFVINRDGSGARQLTHTGPGIMNRFAFIDPTGRFVTFESNGDLVGRNPDGNVEIFVFSLDGS
jgi:Tol biopolymer transport system component